MSTSATDETDSQMSGTHNVEPAFPSSCSFIPTTAKFNLEKTFPSIFTPVRLLRLLDAPDADSLRSLAEVFVRCLCTILHLMNQLPYGVRLNTTYVLARHGVLFTLYLFAAQVGQVNTNFSDLQIKEAHQMALHLLDMTLASLNSLFEVAGRILADVSKPLPALPDNVVVGSILDDETDPGIVATSVDDGATYCPSNRNDFTIVPTSTAEDGGTSIAIADDVSNFSLIDEHDKPLPRFTSGFKLGRVARLFTRVGHSSTWANISAVASSLKSRHDNIQADIQEPKMAESPRNEAETLRDDNAGQGRRAYNIRQSFLIFPDPQQPENDVEMPRPVGDAFDITLNENGVIVAASLSALVRILTSKDSVTDYEFSEMFFVCFRFFSSPMEVFDKLVMRYDEWPPGPLTAAQSRVWEQEARLIKFRVAKVFHTWVTLHWRQEMDKDVFDQLLNFTFKRMAIDLPYPMSQRLVEALHRCAGIGDGYRGSRLQRRLEMQERTLKLAIRPSAGFKLHGKKDVPTVDISLLDVLDFNSATGREELAIQLTIRATQLYCQFDPEDAVIFWRDGKNTDIGRTISEVIDFEKSICFFVTKSVLEGSTPVIRAGIAGFWIDVASRCVQLRNFSVGASILGGIQCPSVDRLIRTVQLLSRPHKEQYKVLCKLFCLFSNLRDYRAALHSSEMPAVPLLSSLIHDIKVSKEMRRSGNLHDNTEKRVINISSYRVVTKTLRDMELCHVPYRLTRVDYIQDWLAHALKEYSARSDVSLSTEFLNRSLVLETRDTNLRDITWLKAIQYNCP